MKYSQPVILDISVPFAGNLSMIVLHDTATTICYHDKNFNLLKKSS